MRPWWQRWFGWFVRPEAAMDHRDQIKALVEMSEFLNHPNCERFLHLLERGVRALEGIDRSVQLIAEVMNNPDVPTGMLVRPNPSHPLTEESTMATGKLRLKVQQGLKATRKVKHNEPVGEFTVTNDPNNPNAYICYATNAAGDVLDVSATSTIATKDDASGVATSAVTGPSTFTVQGNKQGSAVVTITMTANDGSWGPFVGDCGFTVTAGGPTGFTVQPS
jgi:hypothetical protein